MLFIFQNNIIKKCTKKKKLKKKVLFSIGVLHGKQAGKDNYEFVFFLLILCGYTVYKGLEKLKFWIISWPLAVKIIVPSVIVLAIVSIIFLTVNKNKLIKKRGN